MRISRDNMLLDMAIVVSQRSTCDRSHVGVIVAIEGRPLVSGYNGAPTGMPHCDHTCDCGGRGPVPACSEACWGSYHKANCAFQIWTDDDHHLDTCRSIYPCTVAVHAEANAIAFAAKHGVRLEGSSLFSTLAPCLTCSRLIINAGIVEVVYATQYRSDAGTLLLQSAGVKVCLQPR